MYLGSIEKKSSRSYTLLDRVEDRIDLWFDSLPEKKQTAVLIFISAVVLFIFLEVMLLKHGITG